MSRQKVRSLCLLLVAALVAGMTLGVSVAAPAQAAGGSCGTCGGTGSDSSGYTVQATVHLSGDAAPGGGSTRTMGVPASCWWAPWSEVPADPAKWVDFYNDYVKSLGSSSVVASGYYTVPRVEAWEAAAARVAAGERLSVYNVNCVDYDVCKIAAFVGGETAYNAPGLACPLPLLGMR